MYFPSKKDWWLGLIIWVAVLLPFFMLIFEGLYSQLWIPALVVLLAGWVWFGTGYTLTEKELEIKRRPIQYRIPFEDIKKIRKTRNPLSAPALSLDRLEIRYGKFSAVLISPKDKDGFVRALLDRNADIEINF